MRYTVLTTCHAQGFEQYGRRMLDSFVTHWPANVQLKFYAEGFAQDIVSASANVEILDLQAASPELVKFKQTWQSVPRACGDISGDPVRGRRTDAGKSFKWDAVRFSHKVYAIFHAARTATTPWLIWMDADMVCHSDMTQEFLDSQCQDHWDLCYLGRRGKFSECGLYAMQLHTKGMTRFLREFQRMYDDAEHGIFTLDEWHDSFVFDNVRLRTAGLRGHDWSAGIITGEGHPLINSAWGAYLDHLKGNRKQQGHSSVRDLKIARAEPYWQNIS